MPNRVLRGGILVIAMTAFIDWGCHHAEPAPIATDVSVELRVVEDRSSQSAPKPTAEARVGEIVVRGTITVPGRGFVFRTELLDRPNGYRLVVIPESRGARGMLTQRYRYEAVLRALQPRQYRLEVAVGVPSAVMLDTTVIVR